VTAASRATGSVSSGTGASTRLPARTGAEQGDVGSASTGARIERGEWRDSRRRARWGGRRWTRTWRRCRLRTAGLSGRCEFYTRCSGDRAPPTSANRAWRQATLTQTIGPHASARFPVLIKPRNQFSAREKLLGNKGKSRQICGSREYNLEHFSLLTLLPNCTDFEIFKIF
jgi:hypothetical protein